MTAISAKCMVGRSGKVRDNTGQIEEKELGLDVLKIKKSNDS